MAPAPRGCAVGQGDAVGSARIVGRQLKTLDTHGILRLAEGLTEHFGTLGDPAALAFAAGGHFQHIEDLVAREKSPARFSVSSEGGGGGYGVHAEVVAQKVGLYDRFRVRILVQRAEVRQGLVLGHGPAAGRLFLALDRTGGAAVLFEPELLLEGGSGIGGRFREKGLLEILRGRHLALAHDIDERRGAVFAQAQLAHDHGGSAQKPHHVVLGFLERRWIGESDLLRAVNHDRLQVLGAHHRAEPAPARGIGPADHDVRKPHEIFPCRADTGRMAERFKELVRLKTTLAPECGRVIDLDLIIIDPEINRRLGPARNHEAVIAR